MVTMSCDGCETSWKLDCRGPVPPLHRSGCCIAGARRISIALALCSRSCRSPLLLVRDLVVVSVFWVRVVELLSCHTGKSCSFTNARPMLLFPVAPARELGDEHKRW